MSYEERHSVPGSAPYLRGHFPGNPVVPAVVVLEMVQEAIGRWRGNLAVTAVPFVKFKAPLRPDVPFTIALREISDYAIGFECKAGDLIFAQGKAELGAPTESK